MTIKDNETMELEDLNTLRTAPKLNTKQSTKLFNDVKTIIDHTDWLTIGIMSPSLEIGINAIRSIEKTFKLNEMKCVTMPSSDGPIYLKANQKTEEIHARIEIGLGEGILISCHNHDNSVTAKTIGPFPLDFFK